MPSVEKYLANFAQHLRVKVNVDRVIVETIIALGKGLKLELVAEGVENKEQLTFLQEKKCDLIQGFIFSKPLPVQLLEKLLDSFPEETFLSDLAAGEEVEDRD